MKSNYKVGDKVKSQYHGNIGTITEILLISDNIRIKWDGFESVYTRLQVMEHFELLSDNPNKYDEDIREFFKPPQHKRAWAIKR